jgi:hypothetical protein
MRQGKALLGDSQINLRNIEKKAKSAKKRVIIQGFADHSESTKAASSRVRGGLKFINNIQPISVGV